MARKEQIYHHIKIIDFADKGQAIGRNEDGEIFLIPGPVPGDVVRIAVRRKKKGLKLGKVIEYEQLSSNRQIPFCDHFNICGGCKWQHFDYDKQLEFKEKQVLETLFRIGDIPREKGLPIIAAEHTRHFRNKMEYSFSNRRWLTEVEISSNKLIDAREALGFHRAGQFDKVVDIHRCHLQDDQANHIRNFIRDYCKDKGYAFFDIRNQEGLLRNLIIRNSRSGDWMVLLSFYKNDQSIIYDVLDAVDKAFPDLKSLCYVINGKANDSIYDLPVIVYRGQSNIEEQLGEIKYMIGPKSFFQTNPGQAEILFYKIKEWMSQKTTGIVYDLYSGIGSISLFISDLVDKVIGIESLMEAVDYARENARLNHIENVSFHCGMVESLLSESFVKEHGNPELIIVDPPRAGLHKKVLDQMTKSNASWIIYVSCNPSTQARDLKHIQSDFRCVIFQAVDMFPHSHHVESIALLERI